ncbi:MAG: hypothetical protein M3O20_00710 [Acidobacteriota bacterium]|nr:hypothetical protein [Acidobacteriota bacterium]
MNSMMGWVGVALFATVFTCVPAFGEIDLAGNWQSREHEDWIERGPGSNPVDYTGIPANAEGRAKALSYDAGQLSMSERQCLLYVPQYVVFGPQAIRIWSEFDPLTGRLMAWKISAAVDRDAITIWMDGRPHPSKNAFHSFSGFTTGVWEGDMLTTYTTHIKEGYLRRNGYPSSDQATVTEHIMRHGDILTIVAVITDPVYLTEPQVVSRSWAYDPTGQNAVPTSVPCIPITEVPSLETAGKVPHHLPGENPAVAELVKFYNLPQDAILGSAESMYPEYRKKIQSTYVRPLECKRYCCGWVAFGEPGSSPGLSCITNGSGKIFDQ